MKAPTWLLLLLAVLIIGNGYILAGTAEESANAAAPALPFTPMLRIALAALWIVILITALFGLLRERSVAFTWIAPLLTLYAAVGLVWNALFTQSSYSRGSQSFDVLLTLIVLAPVWWIALRRSWLRIPIPGTD